MLKYCQLKKSKRLICPSQKKYYFENFSKIPSQIWMKLSNYDQRFWKKTMHQMSEAPPISKNEFIDPIFEDSKMKMKFPELVTFSSFN